MIGLLLHLGVLGLAIWLFCAWCYVAFWVWLSLGIIIPMLVVDDTQLIIIYSVLLFPIFAIDIYLNRKEIMQNLKEFFKHPKESIKNKTKQFWLFLKSEQGKGLIFLISCIAYALYLEHS